MPLILDTPSINARVAQIFEDAGRCIVVICPYLKIARRLRRTIEVADSKGVPIFLIYGKEKLDEDTMCGSRGCAIRASAVSRTSTPSCT